MTELYKSGWLKARLQEVEDEMDAADAALKAAGINRSVRPNIVYRPPTKEVPDWQHQ